MSLAESHSAVGVVECPMKSPSFDEKPMRARAFNFIRFILRLYRALDPYLDVTPC
jgi:hypothetical protein